jgi:hypothetical protein
VAVTRNLENYLALERLMVRFDEAGDPLADRIRDLLDPIWYRLAPEDIAALDARGRVDPARLVPVRLSVPGPTLLPPPTVAGMKFDGPRSHWESPSDWRKPAA